MGEMDVRCEGCGAEFEMVCPACDREVPAFSNICPHCGIYFAGSEAQERPVPFITPGSRAMGAHAPEVERVDFEEEDEELTDCPNCGEPMNLLLGFCQACGQTFCSVCAHPVGEEDEQCPHCGADLYFDCLLCDFELTAGTEICPNCHALYPNFCVHCQQAVEPLAAVCEHCQREVVVRERQSPKLVYALQAANGTIRIVACPLCGEKFDSRLGLCPNGDFCFCPVCQIDLADSDTVCPRCGLSHEAAVGQTMEGARLHCPSCGKDIEEGDDYCRHCQQLLCPACQAAVYEADTLCPHCGTEFELFCPNCETEIDPQAEVCPACGFSW